MFGFFRKIVGQSKEPAVADQQPLKLSGTFMVQDVFEISGLGIVVVGSVVSGVISPGQKVFVNGKMAVIKSVEAHHKQLKFANAGENIGINLLGIGRTDIQKGLTIEFYY